jgi:FkbM family methyltransferase
MSAPHQCIKMMPVSLKLQLRKTVTKILGEKTTDKLIGLIKGNKRFAEKEELVRSRIEFYSTFLRPGDLVFDIGSNIGNRIRPFIKMGLKVVAVEPQPYCVAILRKVFNDQVAIEQKGVGEKEEIRTMYISQDNHVLSSFSKEWIDKMKVKRFAGIKWENAEKVQITTLDKLIAQYGVPVFIKIDVEGFEQEVLKGLSRSVKMISFEFALPENTNGLLQCLDRIGQVNPAYQCNYAVGESMSFFRDEWMSVDDMRKFVVTNEFQQTSFGDIYVRAI